MPELPEVESVRSGLLPKILGKVISSINCSRPEIILFRSASYASLEKLIGYSIQGIERRGKYLLWQLEKESAADLILAVHLRMTGRMLYFSPSELDTPIENHTHIRVGLTEAQSGKNAGELRWQDVRRFGRWELFTKEDYLLWDKGPKLLGKEPFDMSLTAEYLQQFSQKHAKLKLAQILLDQRCIAGLGNIYVQELLYRERLSPQCSAVALSKADWNSLIVGMREILAEAIKNRGTSFSDYVDAYGKTGNYQKQLQVYGRTGKNCYACGQALEAALLSCRRLVFCRTCQKLKRK